MQINNANSSQAASSPNPDANPNQTSSEVIAVTNSAEAITTASTSCAAQSPQEQLQPHQSTASNFVCSSTYIPTAEANNEQEAAAETIALDINSFGNLLDINMTIDENFDFNFDFDFDALEAETEAETAEAEPTSINTELAEAEQSRVQSPLTASLTLTPAQKELTDESSLSKSSQSEASDEDESPSSSSSAPPQDAATTRRGKPSALLTQLLAASQPLNYSAELAASDRQLAVASASQMRVNRGAARAKRRDANAPIPRRREVLTLVEQQQIVDYSFRHCSGFSLQAAVDFMNSRPAEAFSGILTSSGAPYTFMPFSTYQEILRRIKGPMTHIP